MVVMMFISAQTTPVQLGRDHGQGPASSERTDPSSSIHIQHTSPLSTMARSLVARCFLVNRFGGDSHTILVVAVSPFGNNNSHIMVIASERVEWPGGAEPALRRPLGPLALRRPPQGHRLRL